MPRTHGYAPKGKKCYGICNWQVRKKVNAIGALIGKVLLSICLFNHTIDTDCFHAWRALDLLPKITQSSVIVMDNAAFHKRIDLMQAISNAGHELLFLPPYSPDLNPIEQKWAQVKAYKCKTGCEVEELFKNTNL